MAVAALIASAVPGTALAQSPVTPTTFADGNDEDCAPTNCTLREALGDFNISTVNLVPGTYEVTVPEPIIMRGPKTINGAGATIRGNNVSGVLFLQETTNATINDVTITGGNAVVGGQFPASGGGIYVQNPSTLQLNRSSVTGNNAGATGGGIYDESTNGFVVIIDSTISNNTAGVAGTGGQGAGIYADSATDTEIVNSTISGNRIVPGRLADGAGLAALGAVELVHVTIAANVPAGTATPGSSLAIAFTQNPLETASIWNTIVVADSGTACLISRTITGDHNLDDDGTCGFSRVGDKPGSNPLLGPLQNNGGPTSTHALAGNSPAVNVADVPHCRSTDQRGVSRPQQGTCDIGAYEYVPPTPPAPPPPPPPESKQLPPPVAGKSVNVLPKSGTVRIKRPGASRFSRLTEGQQVPLGTTVDTLKGRVTLVAAADRQGKTATADFYDGIFKISQTKGRRPITTLTLVEKLSCPKEAGSAIVAAKKRKRRLWGDGSGRFRTKGKHSAATVVGTKWLVEDRCTSTLTRVLRGRVSVRDFVKKKTVIVRKGKRYIARAKK